MTAAFLAPNAQFRSWDNSGAPLVGGQLFTYGAGTTTPIATYTDSTGGTPNANPVILNARGEAQVWLLPNVGYKFVLQSASGNPIWTVDQIFNSQLLTLFGGVDTGSANAYVLNFNTPFTSYTNGEVIYFIPNSTNTTLPQPVTLNLNGLGPIPIININGSALGAGQIQAGQTTQVMYYNGTFQLISIGSFSGTTIGTFGQEATVASASTTDLGTALQHVALITGNATITSFGASANILAPIYHVRFAGSLLLTNSTSLILPGAANIQTQVGDALLAQYLGSGTWKVNFYQSAIGGGTTNPNKIKSADTSINNSATLTADPDLITPTLAIGRYIYNLFLIFDSQTAAAGFKFTQSGTVVDSRGLSPTTASGFVNGATYGPNAQSFYGTTVAVANVSTGNNSNVALFQGSLLVGTAGTFGISWAQNTATASNTFLRAGSYLQMQLVSTGSVSNAITHTYTAAGSFTETIPTGYNTLTLEVWGASAGGAATGFSAQCGGGGGSGGYALSNYSVTGHGGQTIAFVVGALGAYNAAPGTLAGSSSAASGTFTLTAMTCTGGTVGDPPASNFSGGPGGPGGAASGGNVSNTSGNSGGIGAGPSGSGPGGLGVAGINGGGNVGGFGAKASPATAGSAGLPGVIIFRYTV
jgi:hypothetical protein